MSQPIELEPLEALQAELPEAGGLGDIGGMGGTPSAGKSTQDLRRLSDVPVDVAVEMGRTRMTVGETLELRQGSIVTLSRMAGEPVDLLVNGVAIARGEVVVIDEQFGLRITDVLGQPHAEQPVPETATEG